MPRFIGGGVKNTAQEISDAVNNTQKIIDIQDAIGRVVTQAWSNITEFDEWNIGSNILGHSYGYLGLTNGNGLTVSRTADNTQNVDSAKRGVLVNPNQDLKALQATISSNTVDFTRAYLIRHSDATILAEKDISGLVSGDTFELRVNTCLQSGTDYRLQIDAEGVDFTYGIYDSPSFPYTCTDFDVTGRVGNGSVSTTDVVAFVSVSSFPATTSGSAESPLITDKPYEWHQIWIDKELDNETVTIDLLDSGDVVLKSGVSDGQDISDIATDIDLKVKASFSRVDTANNPKLNAVSVVWLI